MFKEDGHGCMKACEEEVDHVETSSYHNIV